MKIKTIPSKWLENEDRRLDCGPYMSGAIEAKELLKKHKTEPLHTLTTGHNGGIFNGPRFPRIYVDEPTYGVPFLGSTDILHAYLSNISLLSKKQVEENPALVLDEGWTLITCSGTIGRMAFARSDMKGMAGSQHFMRVSPDVEKIKPGYLYAYLSSRFGVPLVISGTYGAIIQHIEPHHIADLPVPRLGDVEERAHELIQKAADLRTEGAWIIKDATEKLIQGLELATLSHDCITNFGYTSVSSSNLRRRLDASFYCPAAIEAEESVRNGRYDSQKLLNVVDRLFKPPMFKRIWVEDSQYGRQFISGIDAYMYESENPRYISLKTPNFEEFILKKGWVIFQAAGQIYGLFGRPLYVNGWIENLFCADDMYRIVPKNEIDGGYLFLFFRTPHGEVLLKRQASGNSIPRVWDPQMFTVEIPWPSGEIRQCFAELVIIAHEKIHRALKLQNEARAIVEHAIEEGGR